MGHAGDSPACTQSNPRVGILLKQRRGSALPAFSFFLGDFFHVTYVGASLGQDMVKVVSDADEGETFFQEFAYAAGTEEEESEDDVVFARVIDQFLGRGSEFRIFLPVSVEARADADPEHARARAPRGRRRRAV